MTLNSKLTIAFKGRLMIQDVIVLKKMFVLGQHVSIVSINSSRYWKKLKTKSVWM